MPKQKIRFIPTTGKVHIQGGGRECPVVKRAVKTEAWKGKRSISPEAALALDDCAKCATHATARKMIEESDPGAARSAAADTRSRASGMVTWYLGKDGKGWGTNPEYALRDEDGNIVKSRTMPARDGKPSPVMKKSKATDRAPTKKQRADKPKVARPKREFKGITKDRSLGDGGNKAERLAEFGREYGWDCEIEHLGGTKYKVLADRDGQHIECNFLDDKYDQTDHGFISVGEWRGLLTGAHRVRRQMSGERPLFDNPGTGKSAPIPKVSASTDTEDDEDSGGVPWAKDDKDDVVLEFVRGRKVKWRNKISGHLEQAEVPPNGNASIVTHPRRPDDRMLRFAEVLYDKKGNPHLGGERTVVLARIVRIS